MWQFSSPILSKPLLLSGAKEREGKKEARERKKEEKERKNRRQLGDIFLHVFHMLQINFPNLQCLSQLYKI